MSFRRSRLSNVVRQTTAPAALVCGPRRLFGKHASRQGHNMRCAVQLITAAIGTVRSPAVSSQAARCRLHEFSNSSGQGAKQGADNFRYSVSRATFLSIDLRALSRWALSRWASRELTTSALVHLQSCLEPNSLSLCAPP